MRKLDEKPPISKNQLSEAESLQRDAEIFQAFKLKVNDGAEFKTDNFDSWKARFYWWKKTKPEWMDMKFTMRTNKTNGTFKIWRVC